VAVTQGVHPPASASSTARFSPTQPLCRAAPGVVPSAGWRVDPPGDVPRLESRPWGAKHRESRPFFRAALPAGSRDRSPRCGGPGSRAAASASRLSSCSPELLEADRGAHGSAAGWAYCTDLRAGYRSSAAMNRSRLSFALAYCSFALTMPFLRNPDQQMTRDLSLKGFRPWPRGRFRGGHQVHGAALTGTFRHLATPDHGMAPLRAERGRSLFCPGVTPGPAAAPLSIASSCAWRLLERTPRSWCCPESTMAPQPGQPMCSIQGHRFGGDGSTLEGCAALAVQQRLLPVAAISRRPPTLTLDVAGCAWWLPAGPPGCCFETSTCRPSRPRDRPVCAGAGRRASHIDQSTNASTLAAAPTTGWPGEVGSILESGPGLARLTGPRCGPSIHAGAAALHPPWQHRTVLGGEAWLEACPRFLPCPPGRPCHPARGLGAEKAPASNKNWLPQQVCATAQEGRFTPAAAARADAETGS